MFIHRNGRGGRRGMSSMKAPRPAPSSIARRAASVPARGEAESFPVTARS
jgi:hypothetical protein